MITVLFEDDYLILVDKPAHVLSQPLDKDPKKLPIKNLLELERPELKNKLFLHHRLDYETSGVFLLSKSPEINKNLTQMFTEHRVNKQYLCLTRPYELKPGKKVLCEIKDGANWKIKNYMAPALGVSEKRMISVKKGKWPAETDFSILNKNEKWHYVQASPKTGRTHQIRLHLQESGKSILGDSIYGGKTEGISRLMLHASSLEFIHPITRENLFVKAPIPEDFVKLME